MKHKALFASLLVFSACTDYQGREADQAVDNEAILALVTQYQDALRNRSSVDAAAIFAEDAVFLPPNVPAVQGKVDIERYFENLLQESQVANLEFKVSEVHGLGNFAYAWTDNVGQGQGPDGASVAYRSKSLFVFSKTGSDWKVAAYTFNVTAAPQP